MWRLVAGALAVLAIAVAFTLPGVRELAQQLRPEPVAAWLREVGPAAPIAFIAMMATAVVVSPIPSLPLDIAAGLAFGPVLGTAYAVIGALIGAGISFSLARFIGREAIERWLGGHIHFCRDCSDHLLFRVVLLARLLPVFSFDLVSYGAGLTNMSLRRFVLATAIGSTLPTAFYVSAGASLRVGPLTALALGAGMVALFFLLPRWIERNDLFGLRSRFEHD